MRSGRRAVVACVHMPWSFGLRMAWVHARIGDSSGCMHARSGHARLKSQSMPLFFCFILSRRDRAKEKRRSCMGSNQLLSAFLGSGNQTASPLAAHAALRSQEGNPLGPDPGSVPFPINHRGLGQPARWITSRYEPAQRALAE